MARRRSPAPDPGELSRLRAEMEHKKAILDSIKIAFFNNVPFGGTIPDAQSVRQAAQDFVVANHAYQRLLFGRVKVKLSVANLLR